MREGDGEFLNKKKCSFTRQKSQCLLDCDESSQLINFTLESASWD